MTGERVMIIQFFDERGFMGHVPYDKPLPDRLWWKERWFEQCSNTARYEVVRHKPIT